MAQTVFINVKVGASASKQVERSSHSHDAARGSAAASDVTVSFDPTTVKNMNVLRSAIDAAMQTIAGGKELTVG